LKFPDATVQVTAGLPLTGGTMSDDVSIILNDTNNLVTATLAGNQLTVHNEGDNTETFINGTNVGASNVTTGQNLFFNSAGIHYPDSSVQTTAFPPTGGTTSQFIDGTGALQTYGPLGTMSSEPASAYLSTASAVANYLTISSASSTYQTQAGMSAYLSTSAAASTYQTQSGMSAYLSTASASANFIGTSAYATTAQAQAGTSTTTVISPSTLLDAKVFAGYKPLSMVYTWTSAVSGAGATTTANGQSKNVFAPTSATGSAMIYIFNYASSRGQQSASGADFTKRTTIGGRFIKTTTTADANSVFRFLLGKGIPSPAAGDLAVRGIGFRQVANGALELQVHNGTSLFNVTSTFTPTANQSYDVVIVADAGTATMFVNGSSVATSSNAPTALLGTNVGILEVETQNTSTLSGSAMNYNCSDMFAQTNL